MYNYSPDKNLTVLLHSKLLEPYTLSHHVPSTLTSMSSSLLIQTSNSGFLCFPNFFNDALYIEIIQKNINWKNSFFSENRFQVGKPFHFSSGSWTPINSFFFPNRERNSPILMAFLLYFCMSLGDNQTVFLFVHLSIPARKSSTPQSLFSFWGPSANLEFFCLK